MGFRFQIVMVTTLKEVGADDFLSKPIDKTELRGLECNLCLRSKLTMIKMF